MDKNVNVKGLRKAYGWGDAAGQAKRTKFSYKWSEININTSIAWYSQMPIWWDRGPLWAQGHAEIHNAVLYTGPEQRPRSAAAPSAGADFDCSPNPLSNLDKKKKHEA